MKKYLIAAVIIPIIFISCSSFEHGSRNVPDLKEVLLEDIEVLLSEGLSVEAVQDIDYLWREGRLLQSERDFFKTEAVENMVTDFRANIKDQDYYCAYRIYLSLDALSQGERLPDWSEGKLLSALAGRLEESGKDLSALSVRLHIINLLSEDELYGLLDITFNMENIPALKLALKRANEMGLIVEEKFMSKALEINKKSDMQNGMVTVWVDKGMRIERGIGYPDRMMGSGFFVDSKGYIITNYHVIESEVDPEYEGYSRLFVRLSGSPDEKIPAKVVGWDRIFDLALIKVELEPDFVFYSAGSVPVEPGQKIYTIGSPVDPFLENTITSGIISAIGRRRLLQMGDVIQLDAPVNPGNSGGPMLNEDGELLGIVFAGFQLYEGLSFAIPVQWLNKILPRLYQGGEIKHPWLGLSLRETDKGMEVIYTVPGLGQNRMGKKR
jgi:S1-C subfamily serine protease